jgi:Family of unknown function (DUF6338)
MAEFRLDAFAILVVLLPGFLCARLEQRLTVRRDQGELGQVVDALLNSFLIYVIFAAFTRSFPVSLTSRTTEPGVTRYFIETNLLGLGLLALIALVLGVATSFAANNDIFGRLFRWMNVSRRSWRESIWSDVFHNFGEAVQVELADGRVVMGWLKYFSDQPAEARLFLERAAWVDEHRNRIPIDGPGIFLTKESGIQVVAFLNWKKEGDSAASSHDADSSRKAKPAPHKNRIHPP